MKNTVLTLATLATLTTANLGGMVYGPVYASTTAPLHTVSQRATLDNIQFEQQIASLLEIEDFEAIYEFTTSVIDSNPSHARAFFYRAYSNYMLDEDLEIVIADLNQAIAIDSQFVDALFARASIFDNTDRLESAIEDYGTILSIQPDNLYALSARIEDHAILNDWNGLVADANHWISISPDEPAAFYVRAMAQAKMGEIDLAIEDLKTTSELLIAQDRLDESNEVLGLIAELKNGVDVG